jgi:hypothetical protein
MTSNRWLSTLERPTYTWDYRGPPATNEQIDALALFAGRRLPPDYIAFLQMCNGADIWHGDHWLLKIWPSDQIPAIATGYRFDEHTPRAMPFATDGGGEALVFDMRREPLDGEYPILLVNYVTLGWDETIPVARSFRALLLLDGPLFHAMQRGRKTMPGNDPKEIADLTRLDHGTPVYDVSGQSVGSLNLRKTGDYLVVDAPGGRELYLPLSAVNASGPGGIHLGLSSRDLASDEWDAPQTPE